MAELKKKGIVFHGFLGDLSDFRIMGESYHLTGSDLKPKSTNNGYETWTQMCERVAVETREKISDYIQSDPELKEISMIGYSMGSKVLIAILEEIIAFTDSRSLKVNLVFLSSHFGLYQDDNERQIDLEMRVNLNERFLIVLETSDLVNFEKEWNSLGLFQKDNIIRFGSENSVLDADSSTTWSREQIAWYFKEWNRSQAKLVEFWTRVVGRINSLSMFYGSHDQKYQAQANRFVDLLRSLGISSAKTIEMQDRSHRLLQAEDFGIILKHI